MKRIVLVLCFAIQANWDQGLPRCKKRYGDTSYMRDLRVPHLIGTTLPRSTETSNAMVTPSLTTSSVETTEKKEVNTKSALQ